jgi:hypothetical protein
LSRRQFLRLIAAGAGVTVLRVPIARAAAGGTVTHGFLTAPELVTLDAATALIIPTDGEPSPTQFGARDCGVVDYIQSMLSFMPGSDANCDRRVNAADLTAAILGTTTSPAGCAQGGDVNGDGVVDPNDVIAAESAIYGARPVYAGGPFSGRLPQPHFSTGSTPCQLCHVAPIQEAAAPAIAGTAAATVDNYPPNFFAQFLPPSRLQAMSWKIRILGVEAVPEAKKNPLATESIEVNLRNKYRDGLASLDAISQQQSGKPFAQLSVSDQNLVLAAADPDFRSILTYHTIEGMLCDPTYGGNRNRLGWQLIRFDGDSQPLGYEIYDETVPGNYRERSDKPNSRPNPDEDCSGFSPNVQKFLHAISSVDLTKPGGEFPSPVCLDPTT